MAILCGLVPALGASVREKVRAELEGLGRFGVEAGWKNGSDAAGESRYKRGRRT